MDIVRVEGKVTGFGDDIDIGEIRFGIWASCEEKNIDSSLNVCTKTGYGYTTILISLANFKTVTIGSSWTRGLVATVVSAGLSLVAFGVAFTPQMVVAFFLTAIAATVTLLSFIIDIALLAYVKGQIGNLTGSDGSLFKSSTGGGPGFWMTFASFLLLAGTAAAQGLQLRKRAAGESYRMSSSERVKAMMMEDAGK